MLHKSIRWRIQAWHGFLLVCLVSGLIAAFYAYEHRRRFSDLDGQLREAAQMLLPQVGRHGPRPGESLDNDRRPPERNKRIENDDGSQLPPAGRVQGLPEREVARFVANGFYYAGWSEDGNIVLQSANAPKSLEHPWTSNKQPRPTFRTTAESREFMVPMPRGEAVLVGAPTAAIYQDLHRLAFELVLIGLVVVGAAMAVGWRAAGLALQPIKEISETAEKICAGDISRRINVSETESELGELAKVLNRSFEKLERIINEQLRFTADASHELRTPIAVLITQIQLALSRDRTAPEYKQTLETCERAAERLRLLVNQLIELARVDAGDASLVWERCDLGRVARDAVEFIDPLAKKKNVTLRHSIQSVRAKGDVMKLGQVLINLLNNAVHHNADGIEVCLSVQQKENKAIIRVADNGAGIPADALPHLFDRFYRVDKSRARGKGNSGLGLAICKAIVDGHGGTIRAESEPGKGAEFVIELPAYPEKNN